VLAIGFVGEPSRGTGRPHGESDHAVTASVAALGEDQPSCGRADGGRNCGKPVARGGRPLVRSDRSQFGLATFDAS
jgi:hypothetical protein